MDMEPFRTEKCAILDAGSQFAKVIDRRIRELNVESVILPFNTPANELKKYKAIVVTGGPESVYSPSAPKFDSSIFDLGMPILGICYGMQLLTKYCGAGGKIERKDTREDGQFEIRIHVESKLFKDLQKEITVLLTHGDCVTGPPEGFVVSSTSKNGIVASIENADKRMYGVQFHPEVDLTPDGRTMFSNFLFEVAGFHGSYTMEDRQTTATKYIQQAAKDKKVLCLVSGGVDSSVCAALLQKALPAENLYAIHVDSGFMRHEESKQVMEALTKVGVKLHLVEATERFFSATTDIDGVTTDKLSNTLHPEHKRKIIGNHFMQEAERECKRLKLDPENVLLAQGTLRPDLIESASTAVNKGTADCIKTHHNDTSLVRELRAKGRVIEPLKDYHKDEVRRLGRGLGLPEHLVQRQPFPGPGLAIRIICTDRPFTTPNDEKILNQLKDLETDVIKICLLGFRTVGVQGDGRTYSHCVGLTTTTDEPDWAAVFALAKKIPTIVHEVNRVVYMWGAPLSGQQSEVTETRLTQPAIDQLRAADKVVNDVLQKHSLVKTLSQVPVILFPSCFGVQGNRSVCIRTFITNDFMTGVPAVPGNQMPFLALKEMTEGISKVAGVSRVAYDLTAKPPGTTEWE